MSLPGEPFDDTHVSLVRSALQAEFPSADVVVFSWYGDEIRIVLVDGPVTIRTHLTRGIQNAPTPQGAVDALMPYLRQKYADASV